MAQANRLFLLDGMALVYRAYFAFLSNPIRTSAGVNTSAIFGFANTLLDIITKQKPSHLAVAFDTAAPTARHEEFPEYKANRQEMPEDLSASIPQVKRLIEAFNIPVLTLDGYEADDIIGTLARVADEAACYETFMVTPDKDFAQLVSETCKIYKPGRQGGPPEILDVATICEQWEIESPEQVIDILGLQGDSSDNIPGIKGIGEKTAKALIKQFGSVENLLDNTAQLKGKQKENLETYAEQGRLSKRLATINKEVPLDFELDALRLRPHDDDKVKDLMVEFEFNTLGQRLFGKEFKAGRGGAARAEQDALPLKSIAEVAHSYETISSEQERKVLIASLGKLRSFCFDTETTSLDPKTCRLLGLAFSWEAHTGFYVPLPLDDESAYRAILAEFAPLFADSRREIVGHNLKFDFSVLLWHGIRVKAELFDTMLAHSLIDPAGDHKMDSLAEVHLGYRPVTLASLLAENESMEKLAREGADKLAEYAAEDADVTWQLANKLRPMLEEKGASKVFAEAEAPLALVLAKMEHDGVAVDPNVLEEVSEMLDKSTQALKAEIFQEVGGEFNLDSPKQLGEVLFDRLKLVDKAKKTRTGQYATSETVLAQLADQHPIVRKILDYREATKLANTYVYTLPRQIDQRTGRIHTTFHQLLAATGRLASHDPNLQNIPIRTAHGREIRKAFVPGGRDRLIMSADYSQIELRVMASLSGDENMCAAFRSKADIHAATAAAVHGISQKDVPQELRRQAKMVNFGIIYGISAFGLSQRLSIPKKEAEALINGYFSLYPGVKAYMTELIEACRAKGYVETMLGRRRYIPDIASSNWTVRGAAERVAINTPIQGTAADMIKVAMIKVARALEKEGLRSRMILQVHDELVFDVYRDEAMLVQPLVEQCMREALPLKVPVEVETGLGENWLAAH